MSSQAGWPDPAGPRPSGNSMSASGTSSLTAAATSLRLGYAAYADLFSEAGIEHVSMSGPVRNARRRPAERLIALAVLYRAQR
jgi:hypothetical protein